MTSVPQTFLLLIISFIVTISILFSPFLSHTSDVLILAPILLISIPILFYLFYCIIAGHRWALAIVVALSIVVMNSTFRARAGGAAFTLDYQSVLKFSFYCLAFLTGAFSLRFAREAFFRTPGVYVIVYTLWAASTTIVSPFPAYTFAAAFGILAWTRCPSVRGTSRGLEASVERLTHDTRGERSRHEAQGTSGLGHVC